MLSLRGTQGRRGVSLLEVIVAVAVVAVVAVMAIPLARSVFVSTVGPETMAKQIARDMTRARTLAAINAATDPQGYVVRFLEPEGDFQGYLIQRLDTGALVPPQRAIRGGGVGATRVHCSSPIGAREFVFPPVGAVHVLNQYDVEVSGDPVLVVEHGQVRYNITVARATGFAQAVRVQPASP